MSSSDDRNAGPVRETAELSGELRLLGQALAKASTRLTSGANVQAASRALRDVRQIVDRVSATAARLSTLSAQLESLADAAFTELEADLRDALKVRGWHCDGQWPKFFVERAVEIVIDEASRSAEVGGARVASASVDAIMEALDPLVHALIPKRFDAEEFVAQLAAAHDAARSSNATSAIFDVYRAYVIAQQKARFWRDARPDGFSGVSADQFRARLTKALEEGRLVTRDGRALRLLPPLNPKDALFIFQPAENRFAFVGRIEFVKEM